MKKVLVLPRVRRLISEEEPLKHSPKKFKNRQSHSTHQTAVTTIKEAWFPLRKKIAVAKRRISLRLKQMPKVMLRPLSRVNSREIRPLKPQLPTMVSRLPSISGNRQGRKLRPLCPKTRRTSHRPQSTLNILHLPRN
jgi:hypothetical protein